MRFLIIFIFFSINSFALTYKSDGTVIKNDGTTIEKNNDLTSYKNKFNAETNKEKIIDGFSVSYFHETKDQNIGFKIVDKVDGYPVFSGDKSIQVTVTKDDYVCETYDECDRKYSRSRQEMIFEPEKRLNDQQIYEWSIFFPENYESSLYGGTFIGQYKGAGGKTNYNCSVKIPHWAFVDTLGSDGKTRFYGFISKSSGTPMIPIINLNEEKGKWVKIKLHVLYSYEKSGSIKIYKDDKLIKYEQNIQTLNKPKYDAEGSHKNKNCKNQVRMGIYRWSHDKYFLMGKWNDFQDQTIYLDNMRSYKPKKEELI